MVVPGTAVQYRGPVLVPDQSNVVLLTTSQYPGTGTGILHDRAFIFLWLSTSYSSLVI